MADRAGGGGVYFEGRVKIRHGVMDLLLRPTGTVRTPIPVLDLQGQGHSS